MILLCLFVLLFLPSDAEFTTHISDALKLKCDGLPYRTAYIGTHCYFAVSNEVTYREASAQCSSILPGSQVASDVPKFIFTLMMIEKSKFHVWKDSSGMKQSICVYDNGCTCDKGEQSMISSGKCFERADKKSTFQKAVEYCNSLGMEVPSIGNDLENGMLTEVLGKDPAWIRNIYHGDTSRKWNREKSFSRFGTCDQPSPRLWAGWQTAQVCNRRMSSLIDKTGYWSNDGQDSLRDVICVKNAKNAFTSTKRFPGKTCPAAHEMDEETGNCALSCASFVSIPGAVPCYCEKRSKGRISTNGLCRRIGTSKCDAGLIDVGGLCVGSSAIIPTFRQHCISLLQYRTATCVTNELLLQDAKAPTVAGTYTASLDCGSQLYLGGCATNVYNVSIRGGLVWNQVVYFNSADEAVFVGSCATNARQRQETYCSTPLVWGYPRCTHHTGGLGWTRSYDESGCVENSWRTPTTECAPHAILVEGSGGKQCFGHELGAWLCWDNAWVWNKWNGAREVAGPTERDYLVLPRVIIVPGNWMPERVK